MGISSKKLIMDKKTVAICTDFSKLCTGFSKFKRALLRHLYKTGKYRVIEFANGIQQGAPELSKLPWECYSTTPTQEQQARINSIQDPGVRDSVQRQANYGKEGIPHLLRENKVDLFISSQDSWGLDFLPNIPEVQNTTFIPHCTIDSANLIPSQLDLAASVDNLYVWASFAIKEYAKHDIHNIKYLPGCVETDNFFPLEENKKRELRKKFNLDKSFVSLYVFRSQLRKSVPNLMDGFKAFQKKNPEANAKLVLVTSNQEGWPLQQLMEQREIKNEDVYLCYYCRACKHYELRPFFGNDQNCPNCGGEKTFNTINIVHGVDEESLNEIFNCADVFVAPFTSGGMEISPAIEAKCVGIPVLASNYSCGEDIVKPGRGGLPLDFETYYEFQSCFLKSSIKASSICDKLTQVYKMPGWERDKIGAQGREYVLKNLSPEVIGKKFEELIDAAPFASWEGWTPPLAKPEYVPDPSLTHTNWLIDLHNNMLNDRCDKNTSYIKHWTAHLEKTNDRAGTLKHFQNIAAQKNAQINHKVVDFSELLDKDDEGKRIALVCPQSAGDILIINSMMEDFKALYPEYNIYFFTQPQFRDLIEHHPSIYKVLDYHPMVEDIFFMEGRGTHKGYFVAAFYPMTGTQNKFNYQHGELNFRAQWIN